MFVFVIESNTSFRYFYWLYISGISKERGLDSMNRTESAHGFTRVTPNENLEIFCDTSHAFGERNRSNENLPCEKILTIFFIVASENKNKKTQTRQLVRVYIADKTKRVIFKRNSSAIYTWTIIYYV